MSPKFGPKLTLLDAGNIWTACKELRLSALDMTAATTSWCQRHVAQRRR